MPIAISMLISGSLLSRTMFPKSSIWMRSTPLTTSHYTRQIFGRNSSDSSNKSLNSVSEERSLTYLRSSVRADS